MKNSRFAGLMALAGIAYKLCIHCRVFLFWMFVATAVPMRGDDPWSEYFKNTLTAKDPRHTLWQAIKFFEEEGKEPGIAMDLGCGTGRDSLFLIEKNWHVFAIDKQEMALSILSDRIPQEKSHLIRLQLEEFEKVKFRDGVDLINASYSIPFCNPTQFPDFWKKLTHHLSLGGRFAGQFFGERDAWAFIAEQTHHTYQETMNLFCERFELEYFLQEEGLRPCANGEMKYWHISHVVAKKIR